MAGTIVEPSIWDQPLSSDEDTLPLSLWSPNPTDQQYLHRSNSIRSPRLPQTNAKTVYNNDPRDILEWPPWQCIAAQSQQDYTIAYLDEDSGGSLVGSNSTVQFAERAVIQNCVANDFYSLLGDWHDIEDTEPSGDATGVSDINRNAVKDERLSPRYAMVPLHEVDAIDTATWLDSNASPTFDRPEFEMAGPGGSMVQMVDEYGSYEFRRMAEDELDAHSPWHTTAAESAPSASYGGAMYIHDLTLDSYASTSQDIRDILYLEPETVVEEECAALKIDKGKRKACLKDELQQPAAARIRLTLEPFIELTPFQKENKWWLPCNCMDKKTGEKRSFGEKRDAIRHLLTTAAHTDSKGVACIYGCGQRFRSGRLESMRRHWRRKVCTEYRRQHGIEADILPVKTRRKQQLKTGPRNRPT